MIDFRPRRARHRRRQRHRCRDRGRLRSEGARVASLDIGGDAAGRRPGARRATSRTRRRSRRRVARTEAELGPVDVLVCAAGITGASLSTVEVTRRGVAPRHGDRRGRRLLLQPRRPARDGRARLRPDRQRRLDRRQGGQPDGGRLLGGEGGGDRDDEGDREGRRAHGRPRQLHRPRGDRDADPRGDVARSTSTTWSSGSRWAGWARADEVAALACWLASDECSFSTGATYDISGGRAVY